MEQRKIFTFGKELGSPFSLEIRGGADSRRVYTLTKGNQLVNAVSKQGLELLEYLLDRPGKDCKRDQILDAISPNSDHNLVDKYVSTLRDALSPNKGDMQKFIETVEDGYRFRLEVDKDGDLDAVRAFPEWSKLRYHELMADLKRGPDSDAEDLRILTTGVGLNPEVLDILDIKALLRKQFRIRVVLMNPANQALIDARYRLCQNIATEKLKRQLDERIADLEALANLHKPDEKNARQGWLQCRYSDAMPRGAVIHTKRWALLGIALAHTSYAEGPMLEIRSEAEAWEQLHTD